jgi:sporulation protein YlmC with PRC-barrel domain
MMIAKHLAAAVVTTALMIGAASAQSNSMSSSSAAANAAQAHQEGEWRASKLVGVNVYNDSNDKIGDINDVILDKSGKVVDVILGVGGFLGMGEHYVAVTFDKLKWSNEPVRASTASNSSAPATNVDSNSRTASDNTRATTGNATASNTKAEDKWYPDHAVLNATKDQLKAMPQFKY